MSTHVHSLNNSPAKQKYSFGKEGRFRYSKPQYFPINTGQMFIIYPPVNAIAVVHSSVTVNDLSESSMQKRSTRIYHTPITFPQPSRSKKATPSKAADMSLTIHTGNRQLSRQSEGNAWNTRTQQLYSTDHAREEGSHIEAKITRFQPKGNHLGI